MQTRPWTLLVPLSVLGLLLGTQLQLQTQARTLAASGRPDEVAAMLKASEQQRRALEDEVLKLRQQSEKRPEPQTPLPPDLKINLLAGLTPVEGPGVRVHLDEAPLPVAPAQTKPNYRLHDEDVLKVVNELFAAGAEAVSINGQRVVTTTEVRGASSAIMINGVPTAPPYEVLAIGDRNVLEASLKMRGGVVDLLRLWEIQVHVQSSERLTIPAYRTVPVFRFARPVNPPNPSVQNPKPNPVPVPIPPPPSGAKS